MYIYIYVYIYTYNKLYYITSEYLPSLWRTSAESFSIFSNRTTLSYLTRHGSQNFEYFSQ